MSNLKILVFEYITGGGFNKSELPDSLAREGLMMLTSLIDDLSEIDNVELLVMLDDRVSCFVDIMPSQRFIVTSEHDCWQQYPLLMSSCDAVWPIAPEMDGILHKLCEIVECAGKILLASPPSAVALTGDKWRTYQHLQLHAINTVATELLHDFTFTAGEWLIKPVDGIGCEDSFIISSDEELSQISQGLEISQTIIQPHLQGKKTSLSCLFKQGKGWLICVNLQHFIINEKRYRLTGIDVNINTQASHYIALVAKLADAMPDLWGYVGIDLIETQDEMWILEINPRLTSSYAGIKQACGINCAKAVLELMAGEPILNPAIKKTVTIKLTTEDNHAD